MNLKKRIEAEKDNNSILVYQDEVHFQIQTTITCGWFKKGSAPTVKHFLVTLNLLIAALLFQVQESYLFQNQIPLITKQR